MSSPSKLSSKWLVIASLFLVSIISLLLIFESDTEIENIAEPILLPVSVLKLEPQAQQLKVNSTGITQARWITKLVAAVEGRAINLSPDLEPGMLVDNAQLLIQQQSIAYQASVDSATSQLAEAQLNLETTLHQQTVAKNSNTNIRLKTPYARFEPQVQSAKDKVTAARSALKYAHQQLSDTKIRSPFSAIILENHVTPGQWLQAGQTLFVLADQNSIDVKVEIPDSSWIQLASTQLNTAAKVSTNQGEEWPAVIRNISPMRDPATRQRSLILKIKQPYQATAQRQALLPDTQVKIEFSGKQEAQVFSIPASALTEDGDIWTVNQDQQLQLEHVQLFAQTVEDVIVRFRQQPEMPRLIVLYPLGSMIQGQQVEAVYSSAKGQ